MSFFGGEPLLNYELIQHVIQYAKRQAAKVGKTYRFAMTTNGTMLSVERISFLRREGVTVAVSFDGVKDLQDRNRPFKDGGGSYDAVRENVANQLKADPTTECRVTLTGMMDPVTVKNALRTIGFGPTHFSVASNATDAGYQKGSQERKRQYTDLLRLAVHDAEEIVSHIKLRDHAFLEALSPSVFFAKVLANFMRAEKQLFHCGAGRGYVAISCQGDIYICHRFVGSEDQRIGHIDSEELDRTIYLESPIDQIECCVQCPARNLCGGGCIHDHLGATGDCCSPSPEFCDFMLACLELTAVTSCRLNVEDRDFLHETNLIPRRSCPLDF